MIYETVSVQGAEMTVYAPENYDEIDPLRRRPGVILCPGGGYAIRSRREAEPVALQLLARDCCVCILEYATAPQRYPTGLKQLAAAVSWLRQNRERLHVKTVSVMGFSAGAHLAGSLGVRWEEKWLSEELDLPSDQLRPDGMVLCYPVITGGAFTHAGSMENLTGAKDKTAWEQQSLERLVTPRTPPAFLWHTWEDGSVPVENSLAMVAALRKAGVETEFHLYPKGCHGLGLGNALSCDPAANPQLCRPEITGWIDLAARWLHAL